MFGLSSIELLFVGVLALIVIGPRDLPQVVRGAGAVVGRLRRAYRDVVGGVTQLQREIDITDNPNPGPPGWLEFLPDEIRELRASIQPHGDPEETAKKYQTVRAAVAKAQQDYRDFSAGDSRADDPAAGARADPPASVAAETTGDDRTDRPAGADA